MHVHSDIFDVVTHLSRLLGGKLIRVDAGLSLKVKCHYPADLPMLSCSRSAPDTLLQLLLSAAVAERSPAERRQCHIRLRRLLKRGALSNALTYTHRVRCFRQGELQ